jgi:alpha-beta hydrolase superfamily lysophospholipase
MTELPIKRSFKDDFGVEIMFYEWPVANPKAIIQIAHGLGEHARRYDAMAATLNKAGFSVYADDHRGHGQTGLKQIENRQTSKLGQLGPGGMKATIAQVASMSELIKGENPNRPLVLLGHSWGGYIAQKIINDYSSRYDLVVLSGSGLSLPGYSATGNFNKEFSKAAGANGYEWLSRDVEIQKGFAKDPLTFLAEVFPVLGFKNALEKDAVGGINSNKALVKAYRRNSGTEDIELFVYDDCRHEIYNELNKDAVIEDLVSWIKKRVG